MATSGTAGQVRVGVDIGGTFTDLVLALPDGRLRVSKVPSTPEDPGRAVVEGLAELLRRTGVPPSSVGEVVHGTTVASNTILQKRGARVGLLTTRGFRDILEIGRVRMPDLYDLTWEKPVPLVERRHRREVDERIGGDGSVVRPLDRVDLLAAADRLVADGITVLAIAFLNSYVNPVHEREAVHVLRERFPALDVTASSEVLPEIKEYERTSTTVVNAYLLPVMRGYLGQLEAGLRRIGVDAPLLVVASNGGVMGARAAGDRPAFIVASGPAAGVVGAARLSDRAGTPGLIAFDMGGTTAKASLVEDGHVSLTTEYEFREGISTSSRFIKAGGYLLKVPAIDIAEVGAGAGSIGWIDPGGLLRVGPESAGAVPGPACYGLGGVRPTVTDANVVLGLLSPIALAGGELPLDAERARDAIRHHLAEPLGLDLRQAAHGIREVANASMARAIRAVTIERGRDPRELTLVAFGGSGPVHACDVAAALEIRRVLVPVSPGVFTAVGMLASDVEHHLVRAARGTLDALPVAVLDAALEELTAEALAVLAAEGYPADRVRLDCQADLRYIGQASELAVPVPAGRFAATHAADLHAAFTRQYRATYGHSTGEDVEVVNLRMIAAGRRSRPIDPGDGSPPGPRGEIGGAGTAPGRPGNAPPPRATTRAVAFRRGAPEVPTPVVNRDVVTAGGIDGPLIIETYDSTVVVPPGARVRRDAIGNLLIDLPGAS